ncbi:amino acid adenylation domain-containing protein [Fulvivirga maritima]|uniref:non-ribosomal peptide synthetase n=1 Tax=Fulvivirga maritima TaxID=2904247 RepID=UPI001F19E5C0|nr:non-ribosomal peptide synthetase [Fulvivirga maritima]UII24648.1 amino acid adenylation domain-containing protein [Fulvivirga maritima]
MSIITQLRKLKVNISLIDGKLKVNAPQGVLTKRLLQEIKENKSQLINYLEEVAGKRSFVNIERAADKKYYQLSSAQRRLYFLYELDRLSTVYNLPQTIKLNGFLDRDKLQNTFEILIDRHESLRTSFVLIENEPLQKINDHTDFKIEYLQCTDDQARSMMHNVIRPFELDKAPLFRAAIISTSLEEHWLIVDMHHIITDGVSQAVLIEDFMKIYTGASLSALNLTYKDYAEWQNGSGNHEEIIKQKSFWKEQFSSLPAVLNLPCDHKRPVTRNFEGATINFDLSAAEVILLKKLADEEGATLFMVVLSIFNVFLSKLCSQNDIVVGTTASGRVHADLEPLIGMFVNTLALRNYTDPSKTFKDFLRSVKETAQHCFTNQSYQFEELIDDLKVSRDTSRNPLFDVVLVYQNFNQSTLEIPNLSLSPQGVESDTAKFDLTLSVTESKEDLFFSFEYSTYLFETKTIERFISYFKRVVSVISENVDSILGKIEILDENEKHRLLEEFNHAELTYDKRESVISMFEKQVRNSPDSIAVQYGEQSISYKELNNKANVIVHHLSNICRRDGEKRIALLFRPTIDLIASMLAIVKVGCAYINLSPEESVERNKLKFFDSKAQVLLYQQDLSSEHETFLASIPAERSFSIDKDNEENPPEFKGEAKPDDPIYIIYTSGTTGRPKGVEVLNKGILNMVHNFHKQFGVYPGTVLSQVANLLFDASAFEIWPALALGGTLKIAPAEVRLDPSLMKHWLVNNKVEITYQPTAIAEYLLRDEWTAVQNLRVLNIAGDRLKYKEDKNLPFEVFNLYGPTEDSIWTTLCKWPYKSENYSIGKPIANKKIRILGSNDELLPIGVSGEICVSGIGVAKGYLNSVELNDRKFVPDPFDDQLRMYRTGDLGKWLNDGHLEFLGRIDRQVKIRGYRIELDEIEKQLSQYDGIKECAVIDADRADQKYILAYYVAEGDIVSKMLRDYLAQLLPEYMIPAYFIHMDKLPITSNGKLDRNILPEPGITDSEAYMAASNDVEVKLVEIWAEILDLNTEKVSVNTNFFELGGNSIKIIELKNKVNEYFNCDFSIASLFRLTTVAKMADDILNGDVGMNELAKNIEDELSEAESNIDLFNEIEGF